MATKTTAHITLKANSEAVFLKLVRSGDVSKLARIDSNARPWGGTTAMARKTARTFFKTHKESPLKIKSVLIAAILLLWMTTVVPANAKTHSTLVLNVPFQFTVGDRLLSPGTYSFEQLLDSAPGLNIIAIRSADGGTYEAAVTTTTHAAVVPRNSRLVFKRYGNRFFLSQVWTKGKLVGLLLYPSRVEANLAEVQAADEEVSVPVFREGAVLAAALNSHKSSARAPGHGQFEPDGQ